ncbi:peptidylprolyl isomerase [Sneathiella marina]|uniref:Parvulin-like PPIase n=1 Tax=Sneathiella marina TaxID=2950108 RepID=A0ABY4VYI4_9PROT|nr:peptidylprolyl isomerase [Sneathiella marina]USG59983.1 peptidylprolyl isomerase [Sneathiella marina]
MSALRTLFNAAAFAGLLALPSPSATAQDVQNIAAIVNDEIISAYDLDQRISLTILMSSFPNTAETRQQLAKPTLTKLIDDRLKLQEAEQFNLSVSDEEVAATLEDFEKGNNLASGELDKMLIARDIDLSTLIEQFRVQLAWNKIIRHRIVPRITISDEEVIAVQQKLEANKGKNEYLLSEIYLPIEGDTDEAELRKSAQNLVDQIRKGAPFGRAAAQFSEGSTASAGGSIGWILIDDVEPEISEVLVNLPENRVSDPIRTSLGYFIVAVQKIRTVMENNPDDVVFDLTQIVVPASNEGELAGPRSQKILAESLSKFIDDCRYLPDFLTEISGIESGSGKLGKIRLGDLPDTIKEILRDMQPGQASAPYEDDGVYRIFVVCDRQDPQMLSGSEDQIRQNIMIRRAENRARGYLQDMHNSATIETR